MSLRRFVGNSVLLRRAMMSEDRQSEPDQRAKVRESPVRENNMTSLSEAFRRLHKGPGVLVLPNCWDAGSARLLENAGARAVATTSAGLAWSLGYPDGDALPVTKLADAVAAITRVIHVPLSVDMEAGYSTDPRVVAENVAAIMDAGGIGINLEDGAASAAELAAKISAARSAALRAGADLFINARTDVYLRGLVPETDRIAETLSRAALWREAGADGLFVPKVVDEVSIREIAQGAGLPLNVLAWPGLPPASTLATFGVRRLTSGSAIALAAWERARSVAAAFLGEGCSDPLFESTTPYAAVNALFAAR
jgi:2-methylisocitrate lyase-like PEP mutase family enzyme